jgi:hypothetical protein
MTRTLGWAGVALAVFGMSLVDAADAQARHRRGGGSDGGYGSNGGGGSFGGNGSFGGGGSFGGHGSGGGRGGLFSRHRGGGGCGCGEQVSYGSNGGNGSAGGHASHGGHGEYVEGEEHVVEYGDRTYDPGQPPAAPEMRGDSDNNAKAPEMTREEADRAEQSAPIQQSAPATDNSAAGNVSPLNSEENMQNSAAQNPAIGNTPANQGANSAPDRGI